MLKIFFQSPDELTESLNLELESVTSHFKGFVWDRRATVWDEMTDQITDSAVLCYSWALYLVQIWMSFLKSGH